jgi:hypothetical protein
VIILLSRDEYKEAETRVQNICATWDDVKHVHHVPLTGAHYSYCEDASRVVLRPAALITFASADAAATAAAELAADKAVVMRYADYLSLPAQPFTNLKKASVNPAEPKQPAPVSAADSPLGSTKVTESEREIAVSSPPNFVVLKFDGKDFKEAAPVPIKKGKPQVEKDDGKSSEEPVVVGKKSAANSVAVCWLSPKMKMKFSPDDASQIYK